MKILCVEDGSVDVDAIQNGDMRDGKVLVYKKGAEKPFVLDVPVSEGVFEKMWEELNRQCDGLLVYDRGFGKQLHKIIREIEKKYLGETK